jgi:hypothetical protein
VGSCVMVVVVVVVKDVDVEVRAGVESRRVV